MTRRLLAATATATLVFAAAMSEEPSAQQGSGWVTPRTPWGDPDLHGVWPGTAMMGVPIERPRQLGERAFLNGRCSLKRAFEAADHAAARLNAQTTAPA